MCAKTKELGPVVEGERCPSLNTPMVNRSSLGEQSRKNIFKEIFVTIKYTLKHMMMLIYSLYIFSVSFHTLLNFIHTSNLPQSVIYCIM